MRSFIVRIYRTAGDDRRRIVGVVEKAGEAGKQAFTQYDELWEILNRQGEKAGTGTDKAKKKRRSAATR